MKERQWMLSHRGPEMDESTGQITYIDRAYDNVIAVLGSVGASRRRGRGGHVLSIYLSCSW